MFDNSVTRFLPVVIKISLYSSESINLKILLAKSSYDVGENILAASAHTSGILVELEAMTGTPSAIAYRGGYPNPSFNDGYTNAKALAYKSPNSWYETYPLNSKDS